MHLTHRSAPLSERESARSYDSSLDDLTQEKKDRRRRKQSLSITTPRILYFTLACCILVFATQAAVTVLRICSGDEDDLLAGGASEHPFATRVREVAELVLQSKAKLGQSMSPDELATRVLAGALGVEPALIPHVYPSNSAAPAQQSEPTTEVKRQHVDAKREAPAKPVVDAPPSATPSALPQGFVRLRDGRAADGRITQQTCYVAGDESEVCVYEGMFCYDGFGPVIAVQQPEQYVAGVDVQDTTAPYSDPASACTDYRYGEPTSWSYSACRYDGSGTRDYWGVLYSQLNVSNPASRARRLQTEWPGADDVRAYAARSDDAGLPPVPPDYVSAYHTPVDYTTRAIGPHNRRDMPFRATSPAAIFPDPSLGWESVMSAPVEPHPAYPKMKVRRWVLPGSRPAGGPARVDFLEGGLWLGALPGQTTYNPFMSMAAGVAPLFSALHSNASVHTRSRGGAIGGSGSGNKRHYAGGPAWDLPSLDVIAFVGAGLEEVPTPSALSPWVHGALHNVTLGSIPGAEERISVLWKDARQHFSKSHMLCARHGFMPSFKPKIFTNQALANAFRQAAYDAVGLTAEGVRPDAGLHGLPKRITVMDRANLGGRSWYHKADVIAAANATGMAVRYIGRMDFLSFGQQVRAMAQTGVLLAVHGAHLMNSMFLPRGATVIEVTPPLLKSATFSNLAHTMGLRYLPVYSRVVIPPDFQHMYAARVQNDTEFLAECVAKNISSYDTLRVSICNRFSKAHPLMVPMRAIRRTLGHAVEALAAGAATAGGEDTLPDDDDVSGGEGGISSINSKDEAALGSWLTSVDSDLEATPELLQALLGYLAGLK